VSIHIEAKAHEVADTVLLPGDPLRAKYIAENFLEDPIQYNNVRGMLGYTGRYKGKSVSVQGTGMGVPSISIYVHELMSSYNVQTLVRVGTCGAFQMDTRVRDVILAMTASTDSAINRIRFKTFDYAPSADFELLRNAYDTAHSHRMPVHVGSVFTTDTFYNDDQETVQRLTDFGTLAAEMETAALYTLAAQFKRRALSILTVSDHLVTGEQTTAEERQTTFNQMIEVALETVAR
jgi:purine-nucleoside phosphorylase